MRARIRNLSLGALAGVVLVAMLGAGGFPSRPKFQAVGINTPAPAQVGGLALVPSAPGGAPTITVAATAGNVARAEFAGNGNIIGTTGMLYGQDASNIGYVWNRSNTEVRFGTNNLHRGSVTAEGVLDFQQRVQSTVTASALFGSFHAQSSQPGVGLLQSSAAADNRFWLNYVSGLTHNSSIWNDAGSVGTNYITVTRTGTTVDTVNLQATSVQVNGVPIRPTIFCTAACDVSTLAVGQSALVTRGANDGTKSSDATYANDAVLQFLNFPVGSYSYRVGWRLDAGAGGAKAQLNFTGLATDTADFHGVRRCPAGTMGDYASAFTTIGAANDCTGAGSSGVSIEGTFITVAATDDMFTQWAQSASNAAATTLRGRSYMQVTRLN